MNDFYNAQDAILLCKITESRFEVYVPKNNFLIIENAT